MGTLYDQPPRQETLTSYMRWIRARAPEFGFSPDAMTAADWRALCDIVRTALAIQNADAQDEQLAGFGQLISNIGDSLSDIGDSFERFQQLRRCHSAAGVGDARVARIVAAGVAGVVGL